MASTYQQLKLLLVFLRYHQKCYGLTWHLVVPSMALFSVFIFMVTPFSGQFFLPLANETTVREPWCAFTYINSPRKYYDELKKSTEEMFSKGQRRFYVSREEYETLMGRPDEIIKVDGCTDVYFLKETLAIKGKDVAVQLKFDLMMATKFDGMGLQSYYDHRRYALRITTMGLNIIKMLYGDPQNKFRFQVATSFFDIKFAEYFLGHLDTAIRLLAIIVAFAISPLRLSFNLKRDLDSGLLEAMLSKGGTIFLYLHSQFLYSFTTVHLLVIVVAAMALIIELNLIVNVEMLTLLLGFLVIFSYDSHLQFALHSFIFRETSIYFVGLVGVLVQYLLVSSQVDARIQKSCFDTPTFCYWAENVAFVVVPFIPLETFVMALAEEYSQLRFQHRQMYNITSKSHLWPLLVCYLGVVILKSLFCRFVYNYFCSGFYEQSLLHCLPRNFAMRLHAKRWPRANETERTSDASSSEDNIRHAKELPALVLSHVYKRVTDTFGENDLQDINLSIAYLRVTVLYSSDGRRGASAICKLAAGFWKPDRGQVVRIERNSELPRVTYIMARNFTPQVLTVQEYLYILGRLQPDSVAAEVVFTEAIARVLRALNLSHLADKPAKELTHLEQIKLSIAVAMLGRSNVLVLDNPTLGLNMDDKRELWTILVQMRTATRAIFLTTNSIDEADKIADMVHILSNGIIQFSGTTELLKRHISEDQFTLRISRKSKLSQGEINRLLSGCPAIKAKELTLTEYVYGFKSPTEEERKQLSSVLNKLMEKTKADELIVNGLTMNILDDILVAKMHKGGDAQAKQQAIATGSVLRTTKKAQKGKGNSFGLSMRLHMWKRLNIYARNPTRILVHVFFFCFVFHLLHCAVDTFILSGSQFTPHEGADLFSEGCLSVMSVNKAGENYTRSYCARPEFTKGSQSLETPRCLVQSQNEFYQDWIYQYATNFHHFAREFLCHFRLLRTGQSRVKVSAFLNGYSKDASFGNVFHLLSHLTREISQVNFTLSTSRTFHFPEGSNLPEIVFAIFVASNFWMFCIIAGSIVADVILKKEGFTGLFAIQKVSGFTMAGFFAAALVVSTVIFVLLFCSGYLLLLAFSIANPIVSSSFANFLYLLLTISALGCCVNAFNFAYTTTSTSMQNRIPVYFVLLILRNIPLAVAIFLPVTIPPLAQIVISELLMIISPEVTSTYALENLLLRVYDVDEAFQTYAPQNLLTHYHFFWRRSPLWYLLELVGQFVLLASIVLYQDNWLYQKYLRKERQQKFLRLIYDYDRSVLDETAAVESAYRNDKWPEDAVLLIYRLSKFSTLRPINNISLKLRRGECLVLLGLKGAGKSALFSILSQRGIFDEGNFYLFGFDKGNGPPRKLIPGISLAPQKFACDDNISLTEMFILLCRMRGIKSKYIWRELRCAAAIFGLTSQLDTEGRHLTSLQKRQLTLALAFVGGPPVVLIDEPTAEVESTAKQSVWEMILLAKRTYGCSLIVGSSQLAEVEALADRVAILMRGGLHYIDTQERLRSRICRGIQIFLKPAPSSIGDFNAYFQLRKAICERFPDIRPMHTSRYFLHYFMRHSATPSWSAIFKKLEELRAEFDLETYSFTISSMEQIFFSYNRRFRGAE